MTPARNRKQQKETKLILHPFSTGTSEITYIKKIIDEVFGDTVILKDKEKSEKNLHQIHSNDTEQTINNIINEINKEKCLIKESKENNVLIITDLDNATLHQIQKLYKGTKTDNTFFILNKKQFESWLKFYYDLNTKNEQDKVEFIKSISNNWETIFKCKHKNAKNDYFSKTGHCENNKCSNYDSLDEKKEYSDFPHFLKFLQEKTNISI